MQDSEERFRRLTFSSPDTICIFNFATFEIEFVNRESFLGYSEDESKTPGTILNQVHPHDLERATAFWQALSEGHEVDGSIEYRLKHKAGQWEWIHNRATISFN